MKLDGFKGDLISHLIVKTIFTLPLSAWIIISINCFYLYADEIRNMGCGVQTACVLGVIALLILLQTIIWHRELRQKCFLLEKGWFHKKIWLTYTDTAK